MAIKVGQKGRLLNPTANTDQKGRFRLQFDRTLFGNKDIQIAVARGDFMTFYKLINEKGLPVVFSLEPGVREFDLGNIRVE
jgi:hypothetical protein